MEYKKIENYIEELGKVEEEFHKNITANRLSYLKRVNDAEKLLFYGLSEEHHRLEKTKADIEHEEELKPMWEVYQKSKNVLKVVANDVLQKRELIKRSSRTDVNAILAKWKSDHTAIYNDYYRKKERLIESIRTIDPDFPVYTLDSDIR